MDCYLGIDVGTTNVKAAAFDARGELLAYHSAPTPIAHPRPEYSEFEPKALWSRVCECTRAVASAVGAANIRSAAVSAMAEGGLLLDAAGEPLCNIIAWYDMRSAPQCEALVERIGPRRVYELTGQAPSAKYGVTKLMWLMQHEPALAARAAHWLTVEDYALHRLSGEYATDYSVAARSMAYDILGLKWSDEVATAAGIDKALFPRAYPGGTLVGSVTRLAAEESGLAQGTPVCTGGHDHACAAIAVDIQREGVCMDSMGTAEVSMMALERPELGEAGRERCYSVYPHCGVKLYRALTSNQSCGVCVEWAMRLFGVDAAARADGRDPYDLLLGSLTDGGGLCFVPFLRGTVEQEGAQGVYWGMNDRQTRDDHVSAMIDGLCFELRRQIEGYREVFGEEATRLRVVGGLSRSAPIMGRKSRVMGRPVSVPRNTEAACHGAALLGAMGAGFLGWDEPHFVPGREYSCEKTVEDDARYRRYLTLREGVLKLYAREAGR